MTVVLASVVPAPVVPASVVPASVSALPGRVLADAPVGEAAKSGPLWAVVVGVLAVACYFLFRSMIKHMGRVRENFPDFPDEASAFPDEASAAGFDTGSVTGSSPATGPAVERAEPVVATARGARPAAKDRRRR